MSVWKSDPDDVVEDARDGIEKQTSRMEKERAMNAGKGKRARSADGNIYLDLKYSTISNIWRVGAWVQSGQPKGSAFSFREFHSYENALKYFAWMKYKYDLDAVEVLDD